MRTFLCVRAVKCKITKTVAEMNFSTYWHFSIENPGNFFNTDMDGDPGGMGGGIYPPHGIGWGDTVHYIPP